MHRAVGIVFLVHVRSHAQLDVLAEPVRHLAARRHGIDVVEARRVLVAHDEVRLVARQRVAAHEQVVVDARRQRLGQQDAALQVVDVVVHRRHQVDDARDHARGLVANFDAHAFRTGENVLPLQEVERAARAAELLAGADRARLGRKHIGHEFLLAELGGRLGLEVEVRAVQAAIDLRQLVVHVADLEVAPLAVVVAVGQAHVELAHAGRHFLDRAVVAECRVVVIGIDAAEQRVGRFLHEVAEQAVDRTLVRVGAGGQLPLLAELAVDEEREPSVEIGVEFVRCVLALHELGRPADRVFGKRQVAHADIEPVVFLELEIAQVEFAAALGIEDRDFDRVRPFGQDLFADETARLVHGYRPSGHPDLVVFGDSRTAHVDRAARQPDVVQAEAILAVGLQEFRIRLGPVLFDLFRIGWLGLVIDDPERLRQRLVEVAILAVGPQHVGQLVVRLRELARVREPLRRALEIDRHHIERLCLRRLARLEHAYLGAVDERRVVRVHAEVDRRRLVQCPACVVAGQEGLARLHLPRHGRARRLRRNRQARRRTQVVVAELDVDLGERDVGTALDVRGAALRVVDGLAIDRDAHQVQAQRILRFELARDARDVDTFVVVENGELVVDDLHRDVRRLTLDEAGVDDVVRVHVAATLELGLAFLERHVGNHDIHRAACARGRKADVIAVDGRRAPLEPFVARIADEAQPRIRLAGHVGQRAFERSGIAGRNHGLAVDKVDDRNVAPRRVVDARDDLGACILGTQLRFVGKILQRIVIPEFDFDAAVERPAVHRRVAANRPARAAAVAFDDRRRQGEAVLYREGDMPRPRLGQANRITVDALGATGQRRVVGVADEADDDVVLLVEIVERLADVFDEHVGDVDRLGIEADRRDEVLDARAFRVPLDIAQLADRLHAAHFHLLDLVRHEDLLERHFLGDFVVPDLDLDTPVERPALLGEVRGDRLRVAGPLVRDRLGRQRQRRLEVLGDLARSFARQARVVAVDLGEPRRQRPVVRVPDQMQPDVEPVLHAIENLGQRRDGRIRDVRNARFEPDRRHEIRQLDRLERVLERLAQLDRVAEFFIDAVRVLDPLGYGAVQRQVPLDRLAHRHLVGILRMRCRRR